MWHSRLFRALVPSVLIPAALALLALALPWMGGPDSVGSLADTTAAVGAADALATPTALPLPEPVLSVREDQGQVFNWWVAEATATAPTPTPEPTLVPPWEVAAEELPYVVVPPGVAYGPDERWIAVNVSTQRAYAFIGGQAVHVALVTTGMPGFETKIGEYRINYRKQNETMDSQTIGIPRDAPLGYYLTDVLWTQYFYPTVALHDNYWQPTSVFGHVATSHGCVGMLESDAKWFWDFATFGTRVVVYG
ncbi:MAG: L,D-transpeptidase [Dehalococcoidia bacterium]